MKPVKFAEQTTTLGEDQPEYLPLPVWQEPNDFQGRNISCWQLTLKERIKLLFTGRIWVHQLTFNAPLQPQTLQVDTPFETVEIEEVENGNE